MRTRHIYTSSRQRASVCSRPSVIQHACVMASRTIVYIFFVLAVWCSAQVSSQDCETSETEVLGRKSVCKGELIFNEEFQYKPTSTGQLARFRDIPYFSSENKLVNIPDYPFSFYLHTHDTGTPTLEDNKLVITPRMWDRFSLGDATLRSELDLGDVCTGSAQSECKQTASGAQILPPIISSKLTTRNSFAFKFGRVEVRAKLPVGNWLIPEINLEPYDYFYGPGYESGIMRIAFVRGNPNMSKSLFGGPVLSAPEPLRSVLLKEKIHSEAWNKDYHNYTLIWKPDGLILQVDGEWYGTIEPRKDFTLSTKARNVGSLMAPLDRMFHIALGVRVGGVNDFPDAPEKPWKNGSSRSTLQFYNARESWLSSWEDPTLKVEHVKVYAL